MNNSWVGHVYSTQQISDVLKVGRSTVNKYARSLEDAGYVFKKDENDWRAFTEHDLIMFRALVELLSRGVHYDSAIFSIVERYHTDSDRHYLPVAAISSSNTFLNLEEKFDAIVFAIQSLSNCIDERVKSEVASATDQLCIQVNDMAEQVRETRESMDEKLDTLLCRIEKHGKRIPWWKFWK